MPHPGRPDERPFRFDTGPSLLTLPFVFADLFQAAGEDVRDWLPIVKLDPISKFVWPDGQSFTLHGDLDKTLEQVGRISPADVAGWKAFHGRGEKIWNLSADLFLFHAPEQLIKGDPDEGFNPWRGLSLLTTPLRIGMFSRFCKVVDRHIRHPRLREVLYQYATYSGASPFKAPATLAVIPFAETHFSGWYPQGGMYRIAEALELLARKKGVEIRTGVSVRRIATEAAMSARGGRARRGFAATGVLLETGQTLPADAVVCNADVLYAYRDLIDPAHRPHWPDAKVNALDPGGSGMVLTLGVEGTYPQLAHHTKFMPADYRDDLRAMFETRTVPADPCIYVCATTRTDPTQAPDGCENLFVLVSAPPLLNDLDWDEQGPTYEQRVVRTLETRFGLTDLSSRIVVRDRWTPRTLQSEYNANRGGIYGLGSNSRRSAFLRPPNRDARIRNLFFAGGATHPGGGLPLVAASGKIVSELIASDLGL
jgi:phytoene desaturase